MHGQKNTFRNFKTGISSHPLRGGCFSMAQSALSHLPHLAPIPTTRPVRTESLLSSRVAVRCSRKLLKAVGSLATNATINFPSSLRRGGPWRVLLGRAGPAWK